MIYEHALGIKTPYLGDLMSILKAREMALEMPCDHPIALKRVLR
jgi:hypothetical protein